MQEIIPYLWILPLSYVVLYFLYSYIKTEFPFTEKLIFCPMCSAYFTVLVAGFFLHFPAIIQAFLIGMTVTGIQFKGSEYLRNHGKIFFAQVFILQLILTIIALFIIAYYIA